MTEIAIHWFRQDLRLGDNPALTKAVEAGALLPIFILDDEAAGDHSVGGARRWWLHKSLEDLNRQLHGHLRLYRGKAEEIVPRLAALYGAKCVSWTRCYEPWRIKRDKAIAEQLKSMGCENLRLNGSLLWEPWTISKADKTPYRVFTPFFRKGCLQAPPPPEPIAAPEGIDYCAAKADDGAVALDTLGLMPSIPWHKEMDSLWDVSEAGALDVLETFLSGGLKGYKEGRNFPAKRHVSRLSPYLANGQISPNQIWHAASDVGDDAPSNDLDHFRSELAWREFSYHLLFHNPDLPHQPLQEKYKAFDWVDAPGWLTAWQQGQTGIPIVDAGMRELWRTGYMHNRVRMIVGSFLVKNLRLDWRLGEAWFWDCLLDADLANNSASWQWISGCGADAAPYFRVFNPVLQGEKFDKAGDYTRHYVPELADLPDKFLFKPWDAPLLVLKEAGVSLGKTYPMPIVDLKQSREAALLAFQALGETSPEEVLSSQR
ncbi:cryptochrome/photolyase family protein [Cohaesibacter intestini]|uniref:cryptochrome/photolyase family protein n=1 Tax=Cohaesibacter intestini TaxID=2211145 RepID=UPI000DE8D98E|nr:deoxyribodipyrimidine photo-lyase [Cohaesibacter intestini]